MKTSENGVAVMHYFEQCRLRAYPDPASQLGRAIAAGMHNLVGLSGRPWTIGWGDTGRDVVEGMEISQASADARFARRLATEFEPMANAAITVPVTQGQFDAFVSCLYNTGPGGAGRDGLIRLASGKPSSLLRKLNANDVSGARAEFAKWNRAGGQVMLGLRRRRAAEQALFDGADGQRAIEIGAAVT